MNLCDGDEIRIGTVRIRFRAATRDSTVTALIPDRPMALGVGGGWGPTRSSACSAPGGWARSTGPATPAWGATSR